MARLAVLVSVCRDLGTFVKRNKNNILDYMTTGPRARFSKVAKTFEAIRTLRPAYSVKLVFSYVVKGIKMKITAKFCASKRLSFEDTNIIMSLEMRLKSFGTFEKQAPARLAEILGSRCRDPG